MRDDQTLAAFQALLLDRLARGGDPHELKRELLEDERAAPFRGYVAQMEPRCLEIAARIVRKWAVRAPS